jgi:hypothetical protein
MVDHTGAPPFIDFISSFQRLSHQARLLLLKAGEAMTLHRIPTLLLTIATLVAAIAGGCVVHEPPDVEFTMPDLSGGGGAGTTNGTGSANDGATPPDSSGPQGLPCDVDALLENECRSCHSPTAGIAPMLMTRAQLMAPSASDPTRSVAEVSLATMSDSANPMPPAGLMAAAELASLEGWIAAGMPAGSCGDTGAGGAGGGGGAGPSPFDAPPMCSTDTFWNLGDEGKREMYPGRACIDCHVTEAKGPQYLIAGTVFETAHEPDDCFGTLADDPTS